MTHIQFDEEEIYQYSQQQQGKNDFFEPGEYDMEILSVSEETSTTNNPILLVHLIEPDLLKEYTAKLTLIRGKRWLAKQFFDICGIVMGEDGSYDFQCEDLAGKQARAKFETEKKEWRGEIKDKSVIKKFIKSQKVNAE